VLRSIGANLSDMLYMISAMVLLTLFYLSGDCESDKLLEIVSVDIRNLGELVTSLAEEGQQIVDAIDALMTRAHR